MKRFFYDIYLWLVALPLAVAVTLTAAILTIIVAPLFPNTNFAHGFPRAWAKIVSALLIIRVKVYGAENIRAQQSYVFASNHQSLVDIFVIYGWLPVKFSWIMKADLKKIPFIGLACQAAGHIFIDRSTPLEANRSIEEAKEKLQRGRSVVIFPEGTRTRNGAMGKFKRGAFRIASDLMLPILPITLQGSYERLPRNHGPRFSAGTVELFFHPEIDLHNYFSEEKSLQNELIEHTWKVINEKLEEVRGS